MFTSKDVGFYEAKDNEGEKIKNSKYFDKSTTNYEWVAANKQDDLTTRGFIPADELEMYYPYIATGYVVVRSEPSDEKGDETVYNVLKKGYYAWVCVDDNLIGTNAQDGYYKAIYKTFDTNELREAYVKLDNLQKTEKKRECFAIAKQDSKLKSSPIIQEDAENLKEGLTKNGEIFKCNESDNIDINGNLWYKCGKSYISANALKKISDFETPIVVEGMNCKITTKNGNTERATLNSGTIVYVDTDVVYDGKYQVYVKDKEQGIQCTGYMEAEVLGLPDKKPLSNFDKSITVDGRIGIVTNLDGSQQKAQIVPGTIVQVDTDMVYNGKYEVYINDEEKNIKCAGYVDADILGLPDKIEDKGLQLSKGKDGYCYVMEVSDYKSKEGFIDSLESLQKKNLLGGVMLCLGKSDEKSNANCLHITGLHDDATDLLAAENDETIFNDYLDEVKGNFNRGIESIEYDDSLGSIKRLEEYIKEINSRNIPVGFYYQQCSTNPNRASAEAGYVYGVVKKIKADMGSDYDSLYKLPYMEDVAAVSPEIDYNEDRATSTIGKISLLADGQSGSIVYNNTEQNEDSYDYFWTIDDVDKSEGYHLLDETDNQFIYRTGIVPKNNISLDQFNRIEQELTNKGITMEVNSSQIFYSNKDLKVIYKEDNPYNMFYVGIEEFKDFNDFNFDVLNRADLCSFLKDFKDDKGFSASLAVTSKSTIEEMCNGTYRHNNPFLEKMDNVPSKNINYIEPER